MSASSTPAPSAAPRTRRAPRGTPGLLSWTRLIAVLALLALGVVGLVTLNRQAVSTADAGSHAAQAARLDSLALTLVRAYNTTATNLLEAKPGADAVDMGDTASLLADIASSPVAAQETIMLHALSQSVLDYVGALGRVASPDSQSAHVAMVAAAGPRTEVLATLDRLRDHEATQAVALFDDAQVTLTAVIGWIAVAALVVTSVLIARKTRRVFNVGLVIAFGCAVAVAIGSTWLAHGLPRAGAVFDETATQASAWRTVELVYAGETEAILSKTKAPDSLADAPKSLLQAADSLRALGQQAVTPASAAGSLAAAHEVDNFVAAHAKVAAALAGGDWAKATVLATGDSFSTRTVAQNVEREIGPLQTAGMAEVAGDVSAQSLAIGVLTWVTAILALTGAIAAWWGVRVRIKEYR